MGYMEPDELVVASQNLTKTLSTVSAAKYIIHQRRPGFFGVRRRLLAVPSAEIQEAMQTFYVRHGRQMNTADLIAKFGNLSQFLAAQYLLWNRSADEEIFSAMRRFYEEEGRYMEPDELVAASQNLTKTLSTVSAATYIIRERARQVRRRLLFGFAETEVLAVPSAEIQEAMQTFYDGRGRQMNTADLIAK